jgi:hypothetical protein
MKECPLVFIFLRKPFRNLSEVARELNMGKFQRYYDCLLLSSSTWFFLFVENRVFMFASCVACNGYSGQFYVLSDALKCS